MRYTAAILALTMVAGTACTKKLQNDSPKRESSGEASASEGYKDENKKTPAAPARTPEQGTGSNTGDQKDNQPSTNTSTPGTDKPGQGPSNGQSNETAPQKH